jgi:phage-related protein
MVFSKGIDTIESWTGPAPVDNPALYFFLVKLLLSSCAKLAFELTWFQEANKMFTVIFHDEAELELMALPAQIRAKMVRLLQKLESDPRQLREPDTKPLGDGLFEIRTMGSDIARGLWVYQSGQRIFLLRIFIKKTNKTPAGEMAQAWARLKEMQDEI